MDSLQLARRMSPDTIMDVLWDEARVLFTTGLVQKEGKKQESLRDTTTLAETIKSLQQAQEKATAAYGPKFVGTPVEFKLGRVLQRLAYLRDIGDEVMKAAPESASYVWSAFRMIFSAFLKDFETCRHVSDAVDQISDVIFVCQIYAVRQMKVLPLGDREVQLVSDRVLEKIPNLLSLALKFAYETRKMVLKHGRLGRTISAVFGGFDELTEVFKDIQEKRHDLHKSADIAFHEAALDVLSGVHKNTTELKTFLNSYNDELIPAVRSIQSEQTKAKDDRNREEVERDFKEQFDHVRTWTPALPNAMDAVLRDNIEKRHKGTCQWIFKEESFEVWLDQQFNGPDPRRMLCVMGEAGYGKSFLMSAVAEKLESLAGDGDKERPIVLKFYCKVGNDATQKGDKIIAHLVLQLFNAVAEEQSRKGKQSTDSKRLLKRKQAFAELVREMRVSDRGATKLTTSKMATLLSELVKALEHRVYVVLDALDECDDWSSGFAKSLVQLVQSDLDMRLILSSRPETEIKEVLGSFATIDVVKDKSSEDIDNYVYKSLKTINRLKKDERKKAREKIIAKADGMFRYASLAVASLMQPKAVMTPFKKLIKELPDGMAGLYKQELQALDPYARKLLVVSLRWLVCGEGKIPASLVADELERTYWHETVDVDDTDDEGSDDSSDESSEEDSEDDSDVESNSEDGEREEVDSPGTLVNGEEGPQNEKEAQASDTSSEPEAKEEGIKRRDAIELLRTVSRTFLKFDDQDNISLQHASVRDFILAETSLPRRASTTLCPRCQDVSGSLSVSDASLKQGHLVIALYCLRALNDREFQRNFLSESGGGAEGSPEDEAATDGDKDAGEEDSPEDAAVMDGDKDAGSDGEPTSENATEDDDATADKDFAEASEGVGTGDKVSVKEGSPGDDGNPDGTEADDGQQNDIDARTDADSACGAEQTHVTPDEDEQGATLRYEITHWHYHVREAEALWEGDERDDPLWVDLYRELDRFLNIDNPAYKVWQLLKQDSSDGQFELPVHTAARYGVVKYLRDYLAAGGDVHVKTYDGATPIQLLCRGAGKFAGLELLVDSGADINAPPPPNNEEITMSAFLEFVNCSGPTEKLKYLIEKGGDLNAKAPSYSMNILQLAIRDEHWDNLRLLLDQPGVDVNVADDDGEPALHWIPVRHNVPPSIVERFIELGANVNQQDNESQGPLYEACAFGNMTCAEIFLKHGADVNDGEDVYGRTPLHEAIERGHLEMVRLLLRHKADVLLKDKRLRNAVAQAAAKGNEEILKEVLTAFREQGGDARQTLSELDIGGHAPLNRAAARGLLGVVSILLGEGGNDAELLGIRNHKGNTPLHSAATRSHQEVVKVLLEHGADATALNHASESALDLAIGAWKPLYWTFEQAKETAELLLERSPEQLGKHGPELFRLAIEHKSFPLCRALVDMGLAEGWEDAHGWTPLMLANHLGFDEFVSLLAAYDGKGVLRDGETAAGVVLGSVPSALSLEGLELPENDLEISESGLLLHRTDARRFASMCPANHPVPYGCGNYYFEAEYLAGDSSPEPFVAIGYSAYRIFLHSMPGWEGGECSSWGYHSDDGRIFNGDTYPVRTRGPTWSPGDTVGMGIDFTRKAIFVTKNGKMIGDGATNIKRCRVYPVVGIGGGEVRVRANFGNDPEVPFKYDMDNYEADVAAAPKLEEINE